jgi:hypothetical protein
MYKLSFTTKPNKAPCHLISPEISSCKNIPTSALIIKLTLLRNHLQWLGATGCYLKSVVSMATFQIQAVIVNETATGSGADLKMEIFRRIS